MKVAERDNLLKEVHQAVLGVKGTEDGGLVGDFKELKEAVKDSNGRQNKLSKKVNTIIGVLIGCGILGGGSVGLIQLIGG